MQRWSTYTRYGDPEQAAGLQVDGPTFWAQIAKKKSRKTQTAADEYEIFY